MTLLSGCSTPTRTETATAVNWVNLITEGVLERRSKGSTREKLGVAQTVSPKTAGSISASVTDSVRFVLSSGRALGRSAVDRPQCKPRQDHERDGKTATAITAMRGKPPPRSLQHRSDTRHFGACPGP
jgi:hypothetical protein